MQKPLPAPPAQSSKLGLGAERLGLLGLRAPAIAAVLIVMITALAALGLGRISVDDSLTELFRNDTPDFKRYEMVSERFPSSEYDVLIVVEGKDLLRPGPLEALRGLSFDLNLIDGSKGIVSLFSARDRPDAKGYAAPLVPDGELPTGVAYEELIGRLKQNQIVQGKLLSADGELALIVLALDRKVVEAAGLKQTVGEIREAVDRSLAGSGLGAKLTGAPVMQLEIRNAVERDRLVYNGLGLLFGAGIALFFFRRLSLMLIAALPPILAVVWSLGLLGWAGFKLNLFLNVMTPLVMVMGFADSMQMTGAIRDRLSQGDTKQEAIRFAIKVVGPACVLAHGTALLSFIALLFSNSGLIRTFGAAGALSTLVSYTAVIAVLPLIGLFSIRAGDNGGARSSADAAMERLAALVGWIVDRVVARPGLYTFIGFATFAGFGAAYLTLEPRYRLADQVPDREQALAATARLDQKLTGGNPVHIMIDWPMSGAQARTLYSPEVIGVIAEVHAILERQAGLGNVWSLESLRRWLLDAGDGSIDTVKHYVGLLPEHLVRRFVAKGEDAVLVTGRLPDVDASRILPVVDGLDRALDKVRIGHPGFDIAVTGLPAIAARNSADMIQQLNRALPAEVAFVPVLIGLAFRSVFVAVLSLLPGLFPIVAAGATLALSGEGLEFASVVALIVIFGLGIDSLIHFLNRLRLEERAGEDPALSIRRARVLVGPAIILTTIVLAFGLGVTVFSDLPSLRLFGRICGITLLASLIGDLVFLPAMLVLARRMWPTTTSRP